MHRRLRSLAVLAALVCLAPLAANGSAMTPQASAAPHVLRVNWGPGLSSLDPQFSHEGQWAISGGLDYEGLTRIDEELRVVPGAATSWEFSPDGKRLTFHLRDGLVYSDGVPVTAGDFVYAAERLCSPEVNTASSDLLFDVIGCKDLFNAGGDAAAEAAARATFGVHARDERTVEYQFVRPAPYFVVQAAVEAAIPLRKALVDAGGSKWWANPATRIGNGPFRLAEYPADGPNPRLRYVRNERYWGDRAKLDEIQFLFIDYGEPEIAAYRRGDVDAVSLNHDDIPGLEADPVLSRQLVTIRDAGTVYFAFNLNREPFQDKQVREAFAYAFDRDAYCRQLLYGVACDPTLSLIPPGMPGAIETAAYAFDPLKARQALAASSYGGPERLPQITWYVDKDDQGDVREARWLFEQFRQVLGVELKLVFLPGDELDALYNDPATLPQFYWDVWYAAPDPQGWFDNWRCDFTINDHGFCDPAIDALIAGANADLDPARRITRFEEAQRRLVADVPAIWVYNAGSPWLVKPFVVGYAPTTQVNGGWPGWMTPLTVDVKRPT